MAYLPLRQLSFTQVEDAPTGAIGWCPDFPGCTLITSQRESTRYISCFGGQSDWTSELVEIYGHWTFVSEFEVRVDPASFARYEHLAVKKHGSLVIGPGEMRMTINAPSGRGFFAALLRAHEHIGNATYAFTRWDAVTMIDGRAQTIFKYE